MAKKKKAWPAAGRVEQLYREENITMTTTDDDVDVSRETSTTTPIVKMLKGGDFPLGEDLEIVKAAGGMSKLTPEQRESMNLHRVEADEIINLDDFPRELVDAWLRRGDVLEPYVATEGDD